MEMVQKWKELHAFALNDAVRALDKRDPKEDEKARIAAHQNAKLSWLQGDPCLCGWRDFASAS